ncbi:hypothetical protein [Mesoflavibacter zeaxanthinifaciens]|uniref:hypothetical protein n=1 Tax=Mesoflavibacter zeaxanthinifaciens TaxID=393060 RepID=UPI003A8FF851
MRTILILVFTVNYLVSSAQVSNMHFFKNDSLFIMKKQPEKGFYHDYILFIPKEIPINKKTYLLVEPNNTGRTSDSVEVHKRFAIDLASVSSVGNNVSTMLKIPLLVPVFPRPSTQGLIYTHALDRDVMLEASQELNRLDLQLLAMIDDAKQELKALGIQVHSKVFMSGFSASATFINRFSFIHPKILKALAIGGFNGELMLPLSEINAVALNYPIGINDFNKLFNKQFDINSYRQIPQFIYMGKLDQNDAVQFDDAYNDNERQIINTHVGLNIQERYLKCQTLYQRKNIFPIFKTYEKVGHWTTADINFEVIRFFFDQMK